MDSKWVVVQLERNVLPCNASFKEHECSQPPLGGETERSPRPAFLEAFHLPVPEEADATVSDDRVQLVLRRADSAETGDAGVQILADVRAVFANNAIDRSTTKALLAALADLEGRPWAEWNRGRPLSARQLGTLLGRFGIKPGTIRVGDTTPKGYVLTDLVDAFGRYLPDGSATSATTSKLLDNQVELDPPQPHPTRAIRN